MRQIGSIIRALVGIGLGAVMMYFAFRGLSLSKPLELMAQADKAFILAAVACYAADLALRALRWSFLLPKGRLTLLQVGEALIVGYAFNNILPARLGEFVRADYVKAHFRVNRSTVLGSIAIERLADGLTVLIGLAIGLLGLGTAVVSDSPLYVIAKVGAVAIIGVSLALILAVRLGTHITRRLPPRLRFLADDFIASLASVDRAKLLPFLWVDLLIWLVETGAIILIMRSLSVSLSPSEAMVLTGVASLATLVPTAPGYLGSYQFVFAVSMKSFGLDQAVGLAGATLVQIFLLGSVSLCGMCIYAGRSVRRLVEIGDD